MRKPPSPREGLSRLNLCCQTPHYDGDDDDDDNYDGDKADDDENNDDKNDHEARIPLT